MPTIGFPASPTNGQLYPTVNPRWQYTSGSPGRWDSISFVTPGQVVDDRLTTILGTDDMLVLRTIAGVVTPFLASGSALQTFFGGTPSATAPAAIASGQWTLTSITGGLRVTINTLPSDGGSAITALQYSLNSGAWVNFAGTGTGVRDITGLPATLHDVRIRAVNAIGAADPSDTKSDTPGASVGGEYVISQNTGADIVGGDSATYRSGGGTNAGYWEPGVTSSRMLWRPGSNFNTTTVPGVIATATLRLRMIEQFGASTVTAYDNLRAWVTSAGTPSWTEYAFESAWQTAGGSGSLDRSATNIGATATPATNNVWIEIALDAAAVEAWRQAGGVGAVGLQLNGDGAYSTYITDVGTDGLRPELVVTTS